MANPEPHTPDIRSFEVIMDYFEEKLDAKVKEIIDETINSDDAYADRVDQLHDAWLRNPNHRQDVMEFHHNLFARMQQEVDAKHDSDSTQNTLRKWSPYILIAASILALLVFYLTQDHTSTSSCKLEDVRLAAREAGIYEQQYITYSSKGPQPIDAAFRAYDEAQYPEAIKLFTQHLDTSQQDQQAREGTLCLAVSYFMTGQNDLALPYFLRIESYFESKYQLESTWYRALINLEEGNTQEGQAKLQALATKNNPYQDAARDLLNCLE